MIDWNSLFETLTSVTIVQGSSSEYEWGGVWIIVVLLLSNIDHSSE